MKSISEKIRNEAKKLLEEKRVDFLIGFEKGSVPLRQRPCFINNPADTEKLIWDSFCLQNLATYLPRYKDTEKKIGIIAKGCDTRSIVCLILENQIKRENLFIIGVPCNGMVSKRKIEEEFGEVLQAEDMGEEILIKTKEKEKRIKKKDYLMSTCLGCRHHNPVIYDILVGEEVKEPEGDGYDDIREFEKKEPEERWRFFEKEMEKCIRCYACREACPSCYCEECFVDSTNPVWVSKGLDLSDLMIWQLTRVYHQAGRCVDCGSCEAACPVGIKLTWLTRKVNLIVKERFGFVTGLSTEESAPLATFKIEDPQEFIM